MFVERDWSIKTAILAILLCFCFITPSDAAECNTSSGSKCTVSCSTGTATATCSSSSKNCSTSCSDSSGNLEIDLGRSLMIVTEGQIGESEAREFLRYELDIDRLIQGDEGRFNIGGSEIYIDVDPPRF